MRILILGATGMLGNTLFKIFFRNSEFETWGTVRTSESYRYFNSDEKKRIIAEIDTVNRESLIRAFSDIRPDIVINCIGVIKQANNAKDPQVTLSVNSIFPYQLSNICKLANSRLFLISTDCVFSGRKGMYKEEDVSDAEDLYGKSKYIGEIHDQKHVFTMRTSIIGHELASNRSLIDWFLSQENSVKGYSEAIFSGFPAPEISEIFMNYVIPNPNLFGLYHISSEPISKYDLLSLIAEVYNKKTNIYKDSTLVINRSLDSSRFRNITGYLPPDWKTLIQKLHTYRNQFMEGHNV